MKDEITAVISGIKCLGGDSKWKPCSDCPYHGKGKKPCRIAICEDAIRLLKKARDTDERCVDQSRPSR